MRTLWAGKIALLAFNAPGLAIAQDLEDCNLRNSSDEIQQCAQLQFQEAHEVMMSFVASAEEAIAAHEATLPEHLRGLGDAFQASQDAYETFSTAHCKAVAAIYRGGNREPVRENECLTEMSVARVYEIDFLVKEMQE